MMLLTKLQREQLLENGRRQAAVKGTDNAIDFVPSSSCSIPAAPLPGSSPKSIPTMKGLPGVPAISVWDFRNLVPSA
jgi:hypothetical protein